MGLDHRYEQRVETVREIDQQSILMDLFEECYLKKLKVAYVPQLKAADITFFSDIKRSIGFARAKLIIMQFFSIDTYLTKNRGYTVPVLKMELNNVNVALGKKDPFPLTAGSSIKIRTWVSCETLGCNKEFQLEVDMSSNPFARVFTCSECVSAA